MIHKACLRLADGSSRGDDGARLVAGDALPKDWENRAAQGRKARGHVVVIIVYEYSDLAGADERYRS